jgi:predicted transcriptional regulator
LIHQYLSGDIMTVAREKFSSQADPALLAQIRELAAKEGRQFQSVLESALSEYLERNQTQKPRAHVMEAFGLSMAEFDELYKKLTK